MSSIELIIKLFILIPVILLVTSVISFLSYNPIPLVIGVGISFVLMIISVIIAYKGNRNDN